MVEIRNYNSQKQAIAQLQQQIRLAERRWPQVEAVAASTGCDALDALLPAGGVRRGSLVEWIAEGEASGAGTLSLLAGRQLCPADRPFVVVDTQQQVFPLALAALGFDLSTLVIVRPASEREALWACEESLRCEAVGLVWARIERLSGTAFRRLQLAAEKSAGVGFLLRSAKALRQPSWAEVRLLVEPRPTRSESPGFHAEVVYSHGRATCCRVNIEIDYLRGTIHEISGTNETDLMSVVS